MSQPGQPGISTLKLDSGTLLAGKYRIEKQIGAGGMGVVAVATHVQLGQRVALKFLRDEALRDANTVARFQREARAAVQLRSEHVARVIDVGTLDNNAPYMVMEYLEGRDLGSALKEAGAHPAGVAIDYLLQACEAVAEAHSIGIIHRDLKPANLFLTTRVDGRPLVKVLDFGISKVNDPMESAELALTSTTMIMGSPSYMSPEQLRSSRDVDARSDVWALGVILFELLTARLPFEASSVTELCVRVVQDEPELVTRLRPEIPPPVAQIVARCLQKRREDRFQSVAELAQALEPFAVRDASSAAERIRRVGGGSSGPFPTQPSPAGNGFTPLIQHGNTPPPAAQSSARVGVSGGTSVAWGETQVDKPKRRTWPIVLVTTVVVFAALGVLTAFVVVPKWKQHNAALAAQPPSTIPLPNDRKDLPPSTTQTTPAPAVSTSTSAMPEDRNAVIAPPGSGTAGTVAVNTATNVTPAVTIAKPGQKPGHSQNPGTHVQPPQPPQPTPPQPGDSLPSDRK